MSQEASTSIPMGTSHHAQEIEVDNWKMRNHVERGGSFVFKRSWVV